MHVWPPVVRLFVYECGFIALCSSFGYLHPTLRSPVGRPIREAINSWWPPALVVGLIVMSNRSIGIVVLAAISMGLLFEFFRLLPRGMRNGFVETLAFLTIPLRYGLIFAGRTNFVAACAIWVFAVLPAAWIFSRGTNGILEGLPATQFGIVLTVFAFSYLGRLLLLGPSVVPAGGPGLVAFLITAIWCNDAAQYVFGKLFGRHAMAPLISPKKTWEGFAGGVLTTTIIGAAIAPMVTPFDPAQGAGIGASLSFLGSLGDLMISAIKRDAGVKDTGAILPQHGGMLDRFDSLLLAAPLFFYVIQLWLR